MLPNEKNIKSLIKKIQKKCETKKKPVRKDDATVPEQVDADNIFNEMKKLPFKE